MGFQLMNEGFKLSDITSLCNSERIWQRGGVTENKMLFSGKTMSQAQDVPVLQQIFILSVKLLKNTTDGAASQKSNEIDLKLYNYQPNRISFDTSGLSATWPEFWAIGLSFLGLLCFWTACQPTVQGELGSQNVPFTW